MSRFITTILTLAVSMLIAVSCSGSGLNNTVSSPLQPPEMTGQTKTQDGESGHFLWLYNLIYVDPSKPVAEILPQRIITAHWNALYWLEYDPCTDCFKLLNLEPSGSGTLLADIEITHPFDNPNLTGFDVRGIAMFDASHTFPESGLTTSDRSIGDGELVNADGYTTLYNWTTEGCGPNGLEGYIQGKLATITPPDSLLNGYKRHISDDPANTRNALYAGDTVMVTYEIDMPDGPFVFGYAVDANWAPPINTPVIDPMTDFGEDANCDEPWKIEIEETPIGDGLTESGGSTVLAIDVFDWQGPLTHAFPLVECPELYDGFITPDFDDFYDGYARFYGTIENTNLAPNGEYKCLVLVEDNANGGAPEWLDITAYQICMLHVGPGDATDPVAIAGTSVDTQTICEPIHFYDNGSYDPDGGDIVKYEWDWDIDGIYDEEGISVEHTWNEPGDYIIQFRVTDDEGAKDLLDQPLVVHCISLDPTAVASAGVAYVGQPVQFDGTGSHDNDCGGQEITEWRWDFEQLGYYIDLGSNPQHTWYGQGTAFVDLRVTDDENDMATLEQLLEVELINDPSKYGWVRTWSGGMYQNFTDSGFGVTLDSSDNIYITGTLFDDLEACDFDPGPGKDEQWISGGVFVTKVGPDGSYLWSRCWSGFTDENDTTPWDVITDSADNVYLAGKFQGVKDFDPGPGEDLQGEGTDWLAYLCSLDSDGNYRWTRTWGYNGVGAALDVDVDGFDNIYVAGLFFGDDIDFDPSSVTDLHTTNGWYDASLSKFNSSGDFIWAKTWGGDDISQTQYGDRAYSVAAEDSGDVWVTGFFYGQDADFDPDPFDEDLHSALGVSEDAFLSKFDSTGNFLWAGTWGAEGDSGAGDTGYGVSIDGSGGAYVAGTFKGTVDFDPGPGIDEHVSNASYHDVFLSRFDSVGILLWALTWGGPSIDIARSVTADDSGNLYITGRFNDVVDFDPGTGTVERTSNGSNDSFLSKFSPDGTFVWVNTWGGESSSTWYQDSGLDVAVDGSGDVLVTGNFIDECDFDPGPDTDIRTSLSLTDAYLVKFTSAGTW